MKEIAADRQWEIGELDFYVIHAVGTRILDDLSHLLGVAPEAFAKSHNTLDEHGNIASVMVFDVLRRTMEDTDFQQGARGITAGVGPGITAEVTLGTWVSPPPLLIGSDECTALP